MDNFANNKEIEESVLKDLSSYKRFGIINESKGSVAVDYTEDVKRVEDILKAQK